MGYTQNIRSYDMTQTGHDQQRYNQFRSLPATLYTIYTIMWNTCSPITLKTYGRVLERKPVTTQGFRFVSREDWGAGRPE